MFFVSLCLAIHYHLTISRLGSCKPTFHLSLTALSVNYVDQSDNSSWRVQGLKCRLIADWSVENIKLTLSKNLVLLAVSVLQEKK